MNNYPSPDAAGQKYVYLKMADDHDVYLYEKNFEGNQEGHTLIATAASEQDAVRFAINLESLRAQLASEQDRAKAFAHGHTLENAKLIEQLAEKEKELQKWITVSARASEEIEDVGKTCDEFETKYHEAKQQLEAIRKQTIEECAIALENWCFPMNIDWWIASSKKTVSRISALKAVEHLRDIANGTPKIIQEQVMALSQPTTGEEESK